MSRGIFELRTHLAMQNYFTLHPRDYYRRYFVASLFCMNNQHAKEQLDEVRKIAERNLNCSILQAQLILENASGLDQYWQYEYAPMETKTIFVHEAVGILDAMTARIDGIMAENFLMLGGGDD